VGVVAFSTPSLPPACANCVETVNYAIPGVAAVQNAIQQFRSLEGMIRIDTGIISMITNPLTGERILLNHLLQEARLLTPAIKIPAVPAVPALSLAALGLGAAALAAAAKAVNLGKSMMQGLEVIGMRYNFQVPGLPPLPVNSWEVWTSTKLQLPVLSQTIGSICSRMTVCNCTPMQPPAAMFQVPPGYRTV
jgi:hypothetical protein